MKNSKIFFLFLFLAVALIAGFVLKQDRADASVSVSSEYQATTTDSADAGTTRYLIKTGQGSVGSIVVASTTSGFVRVYDSASTTQATSSLKELVSFGPTPTYGTYTYDVEFTSGLLVEVQGGFKGLYTLTYR